MDIYVNMNLGEIMVKKITVNIRLRNTKKQKEKNYEVNNKNIKENIYSDNGTLWEVRDGILYQRINKTTQLSYSCYENVFSGCSTLEIYDSCIKNVIYEVLNGVNCTIFAYGQTGSGKTYTMLGEKSSPGIIKLCLEDIFSNKRSLKRGNVEKNYNADEIKLELSYLEIYNENVIDLINSGKQIRIYSSGNVSMVNNLTKVHIETLEKAINILDECELKRKIGQTEYNERSSRSHTIFQIHINRDGRISTLSLIDLAGSERATGHTERRKEGAYINKSLLALGSVVNKLIKNEYVNYRDSKLTRILQQSLDGNSNVISLCMISPDEECILESISTLKFAARLSKIELRERLERLVVNDKRETCHGCPCCKAIVNETNQISNNNKNQSINNLSSDQNTTTKEKMFKDEIDLSEIVKDDKTMLDISDLKLLKLENMYLKAENELFSERIKALEETVAHLMAQNSSKRINDLFILERNMFNLQLEMIKRKKEE